MAIRYGGILKGIMAAEAANKDDEEREFRSEQYAANEERQDNLYNMQVEQFEFDKATQLKDDTQQRFENLVALGLTPSNGVGSFSKTSKLNKDTKTKNEYLSIMTKTYGLSDEKVSDVYGKGGLTGLKNLHDMAVKLNEQLSTGDYVGETSLSTLLGTAIESAVFTESTSEPYDWEKIEATLGEKVMPDLKELFGSAVTPSTLNFEPVNLREQMSISDLNNLRNNMSEELNAQASSELSKLTDIISEEGGDEAVKNWAAQRATDITKAKRSGSNDDMEPLLSIFGSEYYKKVAETYPSFNINQVPDFYISPTIVPINVVDEGTYLALFRKGLIKTGQVVTFIDREGKTITEKVTVQNR